MNTLKRYQSDAVREAVDILIGARASNRQPGTPLVPPAQSCVLIEAPTGSGKTLMAGTIAARCSETHNVLWFWFAPFAGVVGQAAATLSSEFPKLRVRDVVRHRDVDELRQGDVYVTTWSALASKQRTDRIARTSSERLSSIDDVVAHARDKGYLIGVVVDEAHHGFVKAPVAKDFFRQVLAPDLTLLITATPNDADVAAFRREAGLATVSRISVSRADAVSAGLIKPGIRAVSFAKDPTAIDIKVDFARTAIRYAVDAHQSIKRALGSAGYSITPLMLVQVESGATTVQDAKQALIDFGIPESAIAIHTAAEPDPDVLAIAHDESVEVLIFKMAAALGFDAPRAWALASLRASRDVDFGIQVVGRVLRVDRRLQGRDIPEPLRYGYVFVADLEVQKGLVGAADRLNALTTDIKRVTDNPSMVLVQVGSEVPNPTGFNTVDAPTPSGSSPQGPDGAPATPAAEEEASTEEAESEWEAPPAAVAVVPHAVAGGATWMQVDVAGDAPVDLFGLAQVAVAPRAPVTPIVTSASHRYARRTDIPHPDRLWRERFPTDDRDLADCVAGRINFGAEALQILQRQGVHVVRTDVELFDRGAGEQAAPTKVLGDFDVRALLDAGQRCLFENDYIGGRALLEPLTRRFAAECSKSGMLSWLKDDETLHQGVYRVLGADPLILRKAIRACLTDYVDDVEAEDLPPHIDSAAPLETSRLNLYGVIPPGLNTWEVEFARLLDLDTSGAVLWWHRNEPRKPWSVSVCAPGANHLYYPDFVIGVRGRKATSGILLTETKFAYRTDDSLAKLRADHKCYGRVLMLTKDEKSRWWTIGYDISRDRVFEDRLFSVDLMATF